MKKLLCILLSIILTITLYSNTFALHDSSQINTHINSEYGYEYKCFVDEFGKTISIYTNNSAWETVPANSLAETVDDYGREKAILHDLGMDDNIIDSLSTQQMERVRACNSVSGVCAYIKTDIDGVNTIVDEETAISNAAIINNSADTGISPLDSGTNSFTDSYMRIVFYVYDMGDGTFYYCTSASWLTPPAFRGKDSLGACAMDNAIFLDSCYGYFNYSCLHLLPDGTLQNENYSIPYSGYNSSIVNNGNWNGAAIILDLPSNRELAGGGYRETWSYSNFIAYFEFKGVISTPQLERYFNASATYCHTTVGISFTPSISITTGDFGASIGIDFFLLKEDRRVDLPQPIHYIP